MMRVPLLTVAAVLAVSSAQSTPIGQDQPDIIQTSRVIQIAQHSPDQDTRRFLAAMTSATETGQKKTLPLNTEVAHALGLKKGVRCKALVMEVPLSDPKTQKLISRETLIFVVVVGTPYLLIGGHTDRTEAFGSPADFLYRSDRDAHYFGGVYRRWGRAARRRARENPLVVELFGLKGHVVKKKWSKVSSETRGRKHLGHVILNWKTAVINA